MAEHFSLHPCTVEDGAALARNNMGAFWTDPTWVLMWHHRTEEWVIGQAARRTPGLLLTDRLHCRHQKAIDRRTGALVGYIRWKLPDRRGLELETAWPEANVPAVDAERESAIMRERKETDFEWDHAFDVLDQPAIKMKARLTKDKEYMVLDYLAVHPDHRRQGIATLLVESGLKVADHLGLDAFVHGHKAGLPVYKKSGFRLVDSVIVDDSKLGGLGEFGSYFMVRSASH